MKKCDDAMERFILCFGSLFSYSDSDDEVSKYIL